MPTVVSPQNVKVGLKVKRNPDFWDGVSIDCDESGVPSVGVVQSVVTGKDRCFVDWPVKKKVYHRTGIFDKYELLVAEDFSTDLNLDFSFPALDQNR